MCKLLIVSGINEHNEKQALNLVTEARPLMTSRDKDGYGYASVSADGVLAYERWLNPVHAFKRRDAMSADMRKYSAVFGNAVDVPEVYNGKLHRGRVHTTTLIAHARLATGAIELNNVHPFVDEATQSALIHNGVISNAHEWRRASTCDSEAILRAYLKNDVRNVPEQFGEMMDELVGWHACAVLTRTDSGKILLDVWRHKAELSAVMFANGLQVLATNYDHVKTSARRLRLRHLPPVTLREDTLVRRDAISGELLETRTVKVEDAYRWSPPSSWNGTIDHLNHDTPSGLGISDTTGAVPEMRP